MAANGAGLQATWVRRTPSVQGPRLEVIFFLPVLLPGEAEQGPRCDGPASHMGRGAPARAGFGQGRVRPHDEPRDGRELYPRVAGPCGEGQKGKERGPKGRRGGVP